MGRIGHGVSLVEGFKAAVDTGGRLEAVGVAVGLDLVGWVVFVGHR